MPFNVIVVLLATTPVTAFPVALTVPPIVNELPPDTRTPVELFPDTSTDWVNAPPEGAVPVELVFKNIPILFVSPVPNTFTTPLFCTVALFIPAIPTPFFTSVLLIVPVLVNFEFEVNIPIA